MTDRIIERRALRIQQNDSMPVYLFALAAEEIDLVADVARISRDDAGKLIGYQRPERRSHVKQILEYLDSAEVLFPNGLILALPDSVMFQVKPRSEHVGRTSQRQERWKSHCPRTTTTPGPPGSLMGSREVWHSPERRTSGCRCPSQVL